VTKNDIKLNEVDRSGPAVNIGVFIQPGERALVKVITPGK
jgi:hypothetical protein